MRRIARRPSPATIIALLALFSSLGGVSYGVATGSINSREIKNNSIRGKDVRNRSLTGTEIKKNKLGGGAIKESSLGTVPSAGSAGAADVAGGHTHQAVVNASGALARGRNVTFAVRTGTGLYQVLFNRDVRGCVYVGSVGGTTTGSPPQGMFSANSLATNGNGVVVRTLNDQGAATNRPFHLIVSC